MNITEIRLEALRLACAMPYSGGHDVMHNATLFAAFLTDGKPAETFMGSVEAENAQKQTQPALNEAAKNPEPAKPVEQPAPAAATAKTATMEDCTTAFKAHVARGPRPDGVQRSAMTAREAIIKVLPSYQRFATCTPEEMAVCVKAMQEAA